MMEELLLVYDEEKGCWTERKEPFATVECQTEEDYNHFVEVVEFYKNRDKYVEQKHGRWITQDESRTRFMCSECEAKNYGGHEKFCPNCGAKMDGEIQSPPRSSSNSSSPDM